MSGSGIPGKIPDVCKVLDVTHHCRSCTSCILIIVHIPCTCTYLTLIVVARLQHLKNLQELDARPPRVIFLSLNTERIRYAGSMQESEGIASAFSLHIVLRVRSFLQSYIELVQTVGAEMLLSYQSKTKR